MSHRRVRRQESGEYLMDSVVIIPARNEQVRRRPRFAPAREKIIMRTIPAFVTVAVLVLTGAACETSDPLTGTVVEKEYEPAVYGKRTVDVTKRQCTMRLVNGQSKTVCTTVKTGTRTESYLKKGECYELDIRADDGVVVETCDRDAFNALRVGDRYNSQGSYPR